MSQQLRINVRRTYANRSSERVNSVELHPTEPWILTASESGLVIIWDYKKKKILNSIKISDSPVCSARFVTQKNWIVVDAQLVFIHVYAISNWKKIKSFVAHDDKITCIVVHNQFPYIASASDDGMIKLWDWEKNWMVCRIFDDSSTCVKHVTFCPSESTTIASACLDGSLKIWDLESQTPTLTLDAHAEAVNSVDFFKSFGKQYMITVSDDSTAKVWDYQTKSCIQTLSHESSVSVVCIYSDPSLIITGSKDGEIHIWNSATLRLERTINHGLKGVSCVHLTGSGRVLIGYDEGITMIELNREFPIPCMDVSGNIFLVKHNMVQTVNVKTAAIGLEVTDGEILSFPVKELVKCNVYPQMLKINSNGKYVAVCGDGYYAIYNASVWNIKLSGSAKSFAWSTGASDFAISESAAIEIFRAYKSWKTFRPGFPIECIFGGTLLAVSSPNFIWFYDWTECERIYKLDINARNVHWAESNDLIAVDSDATLCILKSVKKKKGTLELLYTINERVRTGVWAKDCYIFINSSWCLRLCKDGVITKMCNLNGMHYLARPMNLAGYQANQNQVYFVDRALNLVRYRVPQIANDSMAQKPSVWKKVGVHEVRTRMMMKDDYEFSWKDELFNGQHIVPSVRNQAETSTCVFQSLCAAGDFVKMKTAASEHPSRTTDIRFSATSFVSDYEKLAGAIPLDYEHKRLRDGLDLFEQQGVHAEGGGAAPGRYKIASYEYDTCKSFKDVAEQIIEGKPVVGSIRVGRRFGHLKPDAIYDGPTAEESCQKTFSHCVVFVGFGRHDGRNYLVFLNSHGTEFGDDGFGRVYFEHAQRLSTLEF